MTAPIRTTRNYLSFPRGLLWDTVSPCQKLWLLLIAERQR